MGTNDAGGARGPWEPPTAVEQDLERALAAGDRDALFTLLAATDLFLPATRATAGATPGRHRLAPVRHPAADGPGLAVFTRGMLPEPAGEEVWERAGLARLARVWPRSLRWLAVNPGTPLEAVLPADPRRWRRLARDARPERPFKTLRTGPRDGPLAHGMACGALLLTDNGTLWNQLGWQGGGYTEERELLRDWWGVTSRAQWRGVLERLLRGEVCAPAWEFVLRVRQALTREHGRTPDPARWRRTAERVLLARAAEVVDRTGRPPDFDLDADLALVQDLIGAVLRYEARFRADGLLPGDACVRSVLAWDFGRASCVARWGLGARYAERAETEEALLRAGAAARRVYVSWPDFSAGYVLGRCLHFDGERFGDWYTDMVAAHRALATDLESPWLSVSWAQPAADRTER